MTNTHQKAHSEEAISDIITARKTVLASAPINHRPTATAPDAGLSGSEQAWVPVSKWAVRRQFGQLLSSVQAPAAMMLSISLSARSSVDNCWFQYVRAPLPTERRPTLQCWQLSSPAQASSSITAGPVPYVQVTTGPGSPVTGVVPDS